MNGAIASREEVPSAVATFEHAERYGFRRPFLEAAQPHVGLLVYMKSCDLIELCGFDQRVVATVTVKNTP
jgi:hypothetical protein